MILNSVRLKIADKKKPALRVGERVGGSFWLSGLSSAATDPLAGGHDNGDGGGRAGSRHRGRLGPRDSELNCHRHLFDPKRRACRVNSLHILKYAP
jgi:hypothetical protein